MSIITVFGCGKCSFESEEYRYAYKLGNALAAEKYNLANGGYKGTMEALFKGAEEFNTQKIGILTRDYNVKNENKYITQCIYADSYFQRMEKLISIADAFIFLPGNLGTYCEMIALLTSLSRNIKKNVPIIFASAEYKKKLKGLEELKMSSSEFDDALFSSDITEILSFLSNNLNKNQ